MSEHEQSLLEYKLNNLQGIVTRIVEVQESLSITQSNIGKTMALLQQSHSEFIKRHEEEFEPKVNELWENRSQFKGGYIVIAILCALLVGTATVVGAIFTFGHK